MKRETLFTLLAVLGLLLVLGGGIRAQGPGPQGDDTSLAPLGTAFTYQGRLKDASGLVDSTCDFHFSLWDAAGSGSPPSGGTQIGTTQTETNVTVSEGLFTVELDFGTVFAGDARWLQIAVRCPAGSGSYTTLSPRQPLTAVPYALGLRPGTRIHNTAPISAGPAAAGIWLESDNGGGVSVGVVGTTGMYVYQAGRDGVYVHQAGSPSTTNPSLTTKDGFEVAGAEGAGLYVGRADGDGVYVNQVGSPSTTYPSALKNGVEVAGAQGYGLFVGRADAEGVYVQSAGGNGVHVVSAGGYAGYFNGPGHFSGFLTKAGGGFKIDHPLDPANQYLYHSFVESPDMMNVYNGNVTLDANGEAWVELPEWFEVLNGGQEHHSDFRYQLTCIGGFAPVYIAQKIQDNRFQIAGGTPGLEVSWQVTGIRHDPWAEANRLPVEEDKPAEERGTYLHPAIYGQPETMGLAYKEAQVRGGGE